MDVNSAWKDTCRVLLGGEIGGLEEYAAYLQENHYTPLSSKRSAISGKTVSTGADRYCEGAPFISEDEIDYGKKWELDINSIKDLDSLLESLSGRFMYSGNKIFGNSKFVQEVDNCTDSAYVYRSHNVLTSKYVAYSNFVRGESEFIFGSGPLISGRHVIRIMGSEGLTRGFDCAATLFSSDMYLTFNCRGCTECMFSFNLRSKKYRIGNLELPRDRYMELKKKLVGEIRQHLMKHRRFPSVFDFTSQPGREVVAKVKVPKITRAATASAPLEAAFRSATRLVLEKELSPIDKYAKFLSGHVEPIRKVKTPFGNDAWYSDYIWNWKVPKSRMVCHEEGDEAEKLQITLPEGKEVSLAEIMRRAGEVAFYAIDMAYGNNAGNAQNPIEYGSTDCYRISDSTYSKKCGYCTHVQKCEGVFGSSILMVDSSFSLRCHDCVKVSSCMDMDGCKNCFRCMFCHNCEGLSDSMFCFNTKNKKYAIGNVELGREKYMEVRKIVLDELLHRLEKDGTTGLDVCSLGCHRRR